MRLDHCQFADKVAQYVTWLPIGSVLTVVVNVITVVTFASWKEHSRGLSVSIDLVIVLP